MSLFSSDGRNCCCWEALSSCRPVEQITDVSVSTFQEVMETIVTVGKFLPQVGAQCRMMGQTFGPGLLFFSFFFSAQERGSSLS